MTGSSGKTVPVMHACGPDMHVAWLVGAATLMAETRDAWKGTLMPVFRFAPVLHPTLESGVAAMMVASHAWLGRESDT